MPETVTASDAPTGPDGQALLVCGTHVGMRLWDEGRTRGKPDHTCPYETVGYAIEGEATVTVDGVTSTLTPGTSWHVPAGARHHYEVKNHFKAVEATSPPAQQT